MNPGRHGLGELLVVAGYYPAQVLRDWLFVTSSWHMFRSSGRSPCLHVLYRQVVDYMDKLMVDTSRIERESFRCERNVLPLN